MISAWHLLWIVPVSMLAGMLLAALFTAGESGDGWRDENESFFEDDESYADENHSE